MVRQGDPCVTRHMATTQLVMGVGEVSKRFTSKGQFPGRRIAASEAAFDLKRGARCPSTLRAVNDLSITPDRCRGAASTERRLRVAALLVAQCYGRVDEGCP